MTSRDFGFTTLRNLKAYQTNGAPVPSNQVLITSSNNGNAVFSDNITINTLTANSLFASTFTIDTFSFNNITTSTLTATNSIVIGTPSTNVILTTDGDDLYVEGYPVLTEGNISSISSLYWEDTHGTALPGGIFNKNTGQGPSKYMVGIGTGSTLDATLDVLYTAGDVSGNMFKVSGNGNSFEIRNFFNTDLSDNALSAILKNNQDNDFGCGLIFNKTKNNGETSSISELGLIDFYGTNSVSESVRGAYILAKQIDTASTFTPSQIEFATCTSSSLNINMIIGSNGNVGIGTLTPESQLDVNGNVSINGDVLISVDAAEQDASGNSNVTTIIKNNNSEKSAAQLNIGTNNISYSLWVTDTSGAPDESGLIPGALQIYSYTPDADVLVTINNKNVGIGTTDPQTLLDVNGTFRVVYDNELQPFRSSNDQYLYVDTSLTNSVRIGAYDCSNSVYIPLCLQTYNDNTPAGNVGIGTLTPQESLDVCGNISITGVYRIPGGAYFGFDNDSNKIWSNNNDFMIDTDNKDIIFFNSGGSGGSDELMRIKNNGNVGIGTTDPQARLDVNGTIIIRDDTTIKTKYINIENNDSGTGGSFISFKKSDNNNASNIGSELGAIDFYGTLNGTSYLRSAMIIAYQDGAANSQIPGRLEFHTSTANNENSSKMVIKNDGNVGIGTLDPQERLDVNGNVLISVDAAAQDASGNSYVTTIIKNNNSEKSAAQLNIGTNNNSYSLWVTDVSGAPDGTGLIPGTFEIYSERDGFNNTPILLATREGNFAIGAYNGIPQATLHVNGTTITRVVTSYLTSDPGPGGWDSYYGTYIFVDASNVSILTLPGSAEDGTVIVIRNIALSTTLTVNSPIGGSSILPGKTTSYLFTSVVPSPGWYAL